jgi:hypothetical protein
VQRRRRGGVRWRTNRGVTLVEIAGVVLVVGLLTQMVISGQSFIRAARVQNVIGQQRAAESAVLGFRDRFQALPGDYAEAHIHLACLPSPCTPGDGNGPVEAGNALGLREDILAWSHLSASGFLANHFRADAGTTAPAPDNTPMNVFGAYLHIASDAGWGHSGNASLRLNIKTGNLTPVEVLAEVDRKIDDGIAGAGMFQFSPYAALDGPLAPGGSASSCTDADAAHAQWNIAAGTNDCGAATLLH